MTPWGRLFAVVLVCELATLPFHLLIFISLPLALALLRGSLPTALLVDLVRERALRGVLLALPAQHFLLHMHGRLLEAKARKVPISGPSCVPVAGTATISPAIAKLNTRATHLPLPVPRGGIGFAVDPPTLLGDGAAAATDEPLATHLALAVARRRPATELQSITR